MKIAIVGAGIAGLSCATELVAAHHQVIVFDKSRGAGGRMSVRRIDTPAGIISFDHGAQYFTARDAAFKHVVERWEAAGFVARWPAAGPEAWVGVPSMNAPVKAMAADFNVMFDTHIDVLIKCGSQWQLTGHNTTDQLFDAVVLALPAEQAVVLVEPWDANFAQRAIATPSQPCWTIMLAFAEPLSSAKPIWRDDEVIVWAARNSDKPQRTQPDKNAPETWVLQASPTWSEAHLEESPDLIIAQLQERFFAWTGTSPLNSLTSAAHRWRYARSGNSGDGALYNRTVKLGVCGDWLGGPRLECAWQSGAQLAQIILN